MSAPEQNIRCVSVLANADLSANQFLIHKLNSSSKLALCSATGELAFGVLYNKPSAAGQAAEVAVDGIVKCIAGAAIAAGALVATNASGKAVTATKATTNTSDAGGATDALVGSYVLGVAYTAAAADGDVFALHIQRLGAVPTTAA